MTQTMDSRPRLGGLLTTQFFGAFNDNAMKLMVALLAAAAATASMSEADTVGRELATQQQLMIATVVFTLPLMLFSLPSALIADRYSKRSIILAAKVLEFLVMLGGVVVLYFNPLGGVLTFAMLALMGLQSAIFSPAKYGIMPQLCDEKAITRGNGMLELWTFMAIIGGYVAGGALSDWTKPDRGYLAMLLLAGLSFVGLIAALRVPKVAAVSTADSLMTPMRDAWRAIVSNRNLKLVILGQTVFWMLVSLLSQDIFTYALEVLKVDGTEAGMTFAAFGVGIGIGSVLAGRISNHGIEPGLIPLGAVGLAFGTTAIGLLVPGYWGTLAWMGMLGVAAAFVVVPLESMLQWYSPATRRGAVIAIANVPIFAGVMAGSLGVYVLAGVYSSVQILAVAGVITCAATLWAMWLLPQALLRMVALLMTKTLYRLRVEGRNNIPEEGGALLVVNHVSLVDWLFLITSCDRPIRFLSDSSYFHNWFLYPFMKMLGAIPISAGSPRELMRAMKDAGQYLRDGEIVCIFAEGEITRTGALLPFRRGLTRIIKGNDDVPIIPAHLDQVWGSPFSSKGGGFLRSWKGPFPRSVTLSFGSPMPANTPVEDIRREVKVLDEQAWHLRKDNRPPLHHTLTRVSRWRPFKMAVCDTSGKRVSRIQLLAGSILLARKLREAWGDQEFVGILLPPSVGAALANVAASFSGRVSVNLNFTTGTDGMESAVRQAGLRTVVTSRVFLEKAEITLPDNVQPIWMEEVLGAVGGLQRLGALLRACILPVRMLERYAGAIRRPQVDHLATVIFSSGSTGDPKGVMLSHFNIDSNAESVAQVLNVESNDRVLGILPQFHSFGYMATWFSVNNGLGLVCHHNPVDAATIGPLVEREKVTVMIATPTFLQVYMRRCNPGQFGALRAVITGAEKLQPSTADAFEERFGIRPLEGYGTTEAAPVVAVGTLAYRAPGFFQPGAKRGSVGQPIPGVAVKVVDPDSREPLPAGEPGMLLVRGPNVMEGYLGREDLTQSVMHDGWYITGDIAIVDEDGFIQITDRLARFSKIGGEMVPHGKIETVLHELAGVRDERVFCVVGIPDPKKGERLAVLMTIEESAVEGLLSAMGDRGLPNLYIPRRDQFVKTDEIPMLGTGKTDLKRAKTMVMTALGVEP